MKMKKPCQIWILIHSGLVCKCSHSWSLTYNFKLWDVQFSCIVPLHKTRAHGTLWVSGITSRYKLHTSRQANFAIPILELLYVASFAQVLGRNARYLRLRERKKIFICYLMKLKIINKRLYFIKEIGI